MIPSDPSVRESVADPNRRLLEAAHPEESSSRIDQQVGLAVRRVDHAGPQSVRQQSLRSGDVGSALVSGQKRRSLRIVWLVAAGHAPVVIAMVGSKWFALPAVSRGGIIGLAGAAVLVGAFAIFALRRGYWKKVLACRVRIDSRFNFYVADTDGWVRHRRITAEPNYRRVGWPTVMAGALTCLMVAALAVVLLINTVVSFTKSPDGLVPPEGLVCVPGELTVEGSSAFGLAVTNLAGSYHAFCPSSNVIVRALGSLGGLVRLLHAPASDRQARLVLSDGMAPERDFPGLVSRPFAVVPFTFVANRKAPVARLSLEQVRDIFTGKVSRWSEITGRSEDTAAIRVIVRSATSGTRRTLERYVLGTPNAPVAQAEPTSDSCRAPRSSDHKGHTIVCEQISTADLIDRVADVDYSIGYADVPDVKQAINVKQVTLAGKSATLNDIRAGYPFWTVEYIYSYGTLRRGSLASAFADYLTGAEGANTLASFGYYSCRTGNGDMAVDMATLCIPYRYSASSSAVGRYARLDRQPGATPPGSR